MCGIVGIIAKEPVVGQLLEALKRLEYRGYDSAGIATLENGVITRLRAAGKLVNLIEKVRAHNQSGVTGIGHTRWATHGAATQNNAHPHVSERVGVVHNGIIENFRPLKQELSADGFPCATDTDTEVVALLITRELARGANPFAAVSKTLQRLRGAFALVMLFKGEDDLLIGARRGSPLAVGHGAGGAYLASDSIALAPVSDRIVFLEDGDRVVLTSGDMTIYDENDRPIEREAHMAQSSATIAAKGNYRHFMAKEMAEQPDVVGHMLAQYLDLSECRIAPSLMEAVNFVGLDRITITACGSAHYAALGAKYWFETWAKLPVEVDIASEFRYREAPLASGGVSMVISQSGETADTLAALRYAKGCGRKTVSVVNVTQSTIARESDIVLPIFAEPEIGVASTKAFTCQLGVLACMALAAARQRATLSRQEEYRLVSALGEAPRHLAAILRNEDAIIPIARRLAQTRDVLFLGRGINYPIALEGALKLKELSYIHAEAYAAGELKHGPIALVSDAVPVIVLAPRDRLFEKTISNMHEVLARGGQVILISDHEGLADSAADSADTIVAPRADPFVNPLIYALPVQLLAYHTALLRGTDVDQPRNLAKAVTVE